MLLRNLSNNTMEWSNDLVFLLPSNKRSTIWFLIKFWRKWGSCKSIRKAKAVIKELLSTKPISYLKIIKSMLKIFACFCWLLSESFTSTQSTFKKVKSPVLNSNWHLIRVRVVKFKNVSIYLKEIDYFLRFQEGRHSLKRQPIHLNHKQIRQVLRWPSFIGSRCFKKWTKF